MTTTLIQRIDECLAETGWSDRGASRKADLHEGFIREIKRKRSKEPRPENLNSLAKAFDCADLWLATGAGRKERYPADAKEDEKVMLDDFRAMTQDERDMLRKMSGLILRKENKTG